ncbi:MAG: hypothetical protein IPP29_09375 [Bacteroidetes bacterium]|nr:hypothetical protein [Bacteroidota bacterium]
MLKKQEELSEYDIKYKKYKTTKESEIVYNNESYFVARNWGINNIDKFINKFKEKFPGLEYEAN